MRQPLEYDFSKEPPNKHHYYRVALICFGFILLTVLFVAYARLGRDEAEFSDLPDNEITAKILPEEERIKLYQTKTTVASAAKSKPLASYEREELYAQKPPSTKIKTLSERDIQALYNQRTP